MADEGFDLIIPPGTGGGSGLPETPLAVPHGGTGAATLTVHGVVLGAGTSAVAFAGPDTAAKLLMAQGAGADPIFVTVSGDATIDASGVVTLKTKGPGAVGPIGDATHVAVVSTDAQGRVTVLSSVAITGLAQSNVVGLVAALATKLTTSSITNHSLPIGTGGATVSNVGPDTSGKLLLAQGAGADPLFAAMSGDGAIDGSGKLTLPTAAQAKIGSLLIFGHSWVGGNRLSSTGTAEFERQGLVGRLAGLLGIHNDNIQQGGISGSRLLHAVTTAGVSFSGWAYPYSLVTPLDSPLAADNTATSPLSGSTNAFPAAMVIMHGINDANLYQTATALPHTLVETAWSNALRASISRLRAGALFSSFLNSSGAITWDGSLAFSGGFVNVASIGQNTGPAVRQSVATGDTVTWTLPTNVPANFVAVLSFIATSNSWTRITSGAMNNSDVTTAITVAGTPIGGGIDFALGDIIYDPNNPTELMKITTRTSDTSWTVTRGFNGTTKTTHATNDSLVKFAGPQVNFSGTAAAATGSLVVDAQGMAGITGTTGGVPGGFGAQPIAVVKRFVCTAADAGKTIIATTAGFQASAPNQAVNFDSAWVEATSPPPIVVGNLPRFQFITIGVPLTYAIISAFNTNTSSVIAEFDSAVQLADIDAVIFPRGGVLANSAINNTTTGTITGVTVTANGTDFPNTTGWVMVAAGEQMRVAAISGSFPNYTVSLERGYNGSTIVAHASGADVSDATWWNTDFVHPNGYGHGVFASVMYDAFGKMTGLPLYSLALAAGSVTQDVRSPLLGVHDNWYLEFNWNTVLIATTVFTLNTLWFVPFFLSQECICTGIALVTGTTTAGTATAVRVGLYDLASDRYTPGNLIQEFGTGATTALTTVVEVAGHKILSPGWYFAAFVNQGTTAGTVHTTTAVGWTPNMPHHMVSAVPTATTGTPFFNQTGVAGSLPAVAGASMTSTAMPVPWIHLRAKNYG